MFHKSHIFSAILALIGIALCSCQSEWDTPSAEAGGLRVVLENVSATVVTRSTPAELGTPAADAFHLKVAEAGGMTKYDGAFTDGVIHLAGGFYEVLATYGDNPVLGLEAPYYEGRTQVTVVDDEVTDATLTCTVGNALVSVVFGQDDAERERFDKFYSSYELAVCIGSESIGIPNYAPRRSVYFRAGSSVALEFRGVLAANGASVSTALDLSQKPEFPAVFKAADHAIVTLTLPDPESAAVVDISKVEIEKATVESTLPVSWLPLPKVSAEHKYDAGGELIGTDISFTDCYPGMEWQAVVTDADGTVFRTVSGNGALTSYHTDSLDEWPYIPSGEYQATYTVSIDGQTQTTGTRTFTVGQPQLHATVDGYTSYTKYQEGDIEAANGCDAYTIYNPRVYVNVSPSLMSNSRYRKMTNFTLAGTALDGTLSGNVYTIANLTGLTPSFTSHDLMANLTFDKTKVTAKGSFYITGLPSVSEPPTQAGGWTGSGKVSWVDSYVQLGQMAGAGGHSISCNRFAVPAGTKMDCPFFVRAYTGWVGSTLRLSVGSQVYYEQNCGGSITGASYEIVVPHTYITVDDQFSNVTCLYSYGSGQTYAGILKLAYLYAE